MAGEILGAVSVAAAVVGDEEMAVALSEMRGGKSLVYFWEKRFEEKAEAATVTAAMMAIL